METPSSKTWTKNSMRTLSCSTRSVSLFKFTLKIPLATILGFNFRLVLFFTISIRCRRVKPTMDMRARSWKKSLVVRRFSHIYCRLTKSQKSIVRFKRSHFVCWYLVSRHTASCAPNTRGKCHLIFLSSLSFVL